jgi:hypothetical protein
MLRKWLIPVALPLAGVAFFLYGLHTFDQFLRGQMREQPRYLLPFDQIGTKAPPGLSRQQFLSEVQKLSDYPDKIYLLDDDVIPRLREAFSKHAWVEEVRQIDIMGSAGVRVEVDFRVPVLAIPQTGAMRLVDGKGKLLPGNDPVNGVAMWRGHATTPLGPSGTLWGDKDIEATAAILGLLKPHQEKLQIKAAAVTAGEIIFTTREGSLILWGRPAGKEGKEEATEKEKLAFLAGHSQVPQPGPQEIDLRPKKKPILRPLGPG